MEGGPGGPGRVSGAELIPLHLIVCDSGAVARLGAAVRSTLPRSTLVIRILVKTTAYLARLLQLLMKRAVSLFKPRIIRPTHLPYSCMPLLFFRPWGSVQTQK